VFESKGHSIQRSKEFLPLPALDDFDLVVIVQLKRDDFKGCYSALIKSGLRNETLVGSPCAYLSVKIEYKIPEAVCDQTMFVDLDTLIYVWMVA
jgi:hypothetical protein